MVRRNCSTAKTRRASSSKSTSQSPHRKWSSVKAVHRSSPSPLLGFHPRCVSHQEEKRRPPSKSNTRPSSSSAKTALKNATSSPDRAWLHDWSWDRPDRVVRPNEPLGGGGGGGGRVSSVASATAWRPSRDGPRTAELPRKRKTIPLVLVSDDQSREARPLTLLQAVTSTLPSVRKGRRRRPHRDVQPPRTATSGAKTYSGSKYHVIVPQGPRGCRKPDSFEKLLLDALSVPAKHAHVREKIMGTKNYMKLFFPSHRLQNYSSNNNEVPLPNFPNYAQMTRRPKPVSNITLAQYITNVLSFMRETIYKKSEKEQEEEQEQMQVPPPADRYKELPESPVDD